MLPVLAVVCPPLAVLATGSVGRAAANFGLTLLFFAPGAVHARREVGRFADARRTARLLEAVSLYGA